MECSQDAHDHTYTVGMIVGRPRGCNGWAGNIGKVLERQTFSLNFSSLQFLKFPDRREPEDHLGSPVPIPTTLTVRPAQG